MTPQEARKYIENFNHIIGKKVTYVDFNHGERVHFNNMTDEQAIRVANCFMDMEAEAAERSPQIKQ